MPKEVKTTTSFFAVVVCILLLNPFAFSDCKKLTDQFLKIQKQIAETNASLFELLVDIKQKDFSNSQKIAKHQANLAMNLNLLIYEKCPTNLKIDSDTFYKSAYDCQIARNKAITEKTGYPANECNQDNWLP